MTASDRLKRPYPYLPRSFKSAYPFSLAATSFIYPDYMAPNARMLGPYLDEMELLFFESRHPGSLPQPQEIHELKSLSQKYGLSYNIHLPLDISLTAKAAAERRQAVETIKYCIDLAGCLSPTTWTIHLPYEDEGDDFNDWLDRTGESLSQLFPAYIEGSMFSVETLSYPLEWIDGLLRAFDLSICLDICHMAVHGLDWKAFYELYAEKIPIIHLYGFRKAHEHLGLDQLSADIRQSVAEILDRFYGTLCLEVFSYPHLDASLKILSQLA
ncbi:MAG: TIM barrel protein [Desulfobacterales bacterium]|nr:TIM barrel protein [Desulfobacterales bacterium]